MVVVFLLCLQTAHCSLLLSLSLVCVRFDKQTRVGGVRGNRTGDVLCLACQSISLEEGLDFGLQTEKKKAVEEDRGGGERACNLVVERLETLFSKHIHKKNL